MDTERKKVYISPTFLDSFAYYLNYEGEEVSGKLRQDLIDRLRGVRTPPSEAMQKGISFETDVCALLAGGYTPKGSSYDTIVNEAARYIGNEVTYQKRIEFEATVHYCAIHPYVNGYIDFLRGNTIIDLKTTKQYVFGKYRNNNQHLAYLTWGKEHDINRFVYLVLDWSTMTLTREEYFYVPSLEKKLYSNIANFVSYLDRDIEMRQAFLNHVPYSADKN